jgi:hypothetical protein
MITKVAKTRKASAGAVGGRPQHGRNVGGLLRYLYGPGKKDEHEDPHLVASWDGQAHDHEPETFTRPDGSAYPSIARLAGELTDPLDAALGIGLDDPHVYHLVLSNKAGLDRDLTDDEWGQAAADMLDAVGVAPAGDPDGCRWVAVRHGKSASGNDHVHVVATLARQDGRAVKPWGDFAKLRTVAQKWEREHGLTVTADADHTRRHTPTAGEREKEIRQGVTLPRRDTLSAKVATAAEVAKDEDTFFAQLRSQGLMVKQRFSVAQPGTVTGYAVGIPGHMDRDSRQVYYSGSKLDGQSLPALRRGWVGRPGVTPAGDPVAAATKAFTAASKTLADPSVDRAVKAGLADVSAKAVRSWALANESPRFDGPLTQAGQDLTRASRPTEPTRSGAGAAKMALAGHMLSVMKSSAQTKDERQRIELLSSMVMLSGAIAKWRQDGGKPVQAAAAARSANALRDTMPATSPAGQQRLPSQHPTPAPGQTPGQRKGPRL